jgi:SAM-dependent methyltransferase
MKPNAASLEAIQEGRIWGSAPWDRLAETMSDVYDDLVERLDPSEGEEWLDVATGTGAVALRAARRGARVTAQDIATALLDYASRAAAAERLEIQFDFGDAAQLPYGDRSFDVVSSAFGVSFVPDHEAAAAELGRVCRPSGRLGLVDWLPERYPEFEEMLAQFRPTDAGGGRKRLNWGRADHVRKLLGETFELEFHEGNSPWRGESGEAVWELYATANGKARRWISSLPTHRRKALRDAWVDYFESYREGGHVAAPRAYIIVIGRRRP